MSLQPSRGPNPKRAHLVALLRLCCQLVRCSSLPASPRAPNTRRTHPRTSSRFCASASSCSDTSSSAFQNSACRGSYLSNSCETRRQQNSDPARGLLKRLRRSAAGLRARRRLAASARPLTGCACAAGGEASALWRSRAGARGAAGGTRWRGEPVSRGWTHRVLLDVVVELRHVVQLQALKVLPRVLNRQREARAARRRHSPAPPHPRSTRRQTPWGKRIVAGSSARCFRRQARCSQRGGSGREDAPAGRSYRASPQPPRPPSSTHTSDAPGRWAPAPPCGPNRCESNRPPRTHLVREVGRVAEPEPHMEVARDEVAGRGPVLPQAPLRLGLRGSSAPRGKRRQHDANLQRRGHARVAWQAGRARAAVPPWAAAPAPERHGVEACRCHPGGVRREGGGRVRRTRGGSCRLPHARGGGARTHQQALEVELLLLGLALHGLLGRAHALHQVLHARGRAACKGQQHGSGGRRRACLAAR